MAMTKEQIEECARIICEARVRSHFVDNLPNALVPKTLPEGYAVQERVLALQGVPTTGYLLGLTNEYMQKIFGVDRPYYSPILKTNIYTSPARFARGALLTRGLECEVVFRMAADLPPRGAPYTPDEVADAVATMHPGIEIVNAHFPNWLDLPMPLVAADNGTDGPLVVGEGISDWRRIDRVSLPVVLYLNGEVAAQGSGGNALGDPLTALSWLANELNAKGAGLKAGETINTGTCAKLIPAKEGDEARASFGALGEVRIRFDS
ncbi:MAG: 2-keto-4-pentenoate hydratase [Alphaproteobacteria bacterium]